MTTRRVTLAITALVLLGLVPAVQAQEPPPSEVPAVVQIEDPVGDANYQGEDQTTPADLTISDLMSVWFTHDATNLSVHIQTEGPPPSGNASYVFRVTTNPGEREVGCLEFEAIIEGPTYVGDSFARLDDECAADDFEPIAGELTIVEASDGTGITTVTIPRASHPALADEAVIATPWAATLNNTGGPSRLVGPTVDDTKVGSDYTIASDEPRPKAKKKKKKSKRPGPPVLVLTGGNARAL